MKKSLFIILFSLGVLIRFFHLGDHIESPHTWRQSDTANYIWDFYNNGIDLLSPSVCWMGDHKTVILEFPISEAFVALSYTVFGPSHTNAKICFLLLFLGSCVYFYKLIHHFFNHDITRIITLVYLFAPLSQFYSRAIHIDYSELMFVFAMVYYYLKGIKNSSYINLIVGSIFATLAFITKAPYAVFFSIPLLAYILINKQILFVLKRMYIFLVPVGVFIAWQNYVFTVNDAVPDWIFIPGFKKFTYSPGWYYGDLSQRMDVENWDLILSRLFNEILGYLGLVLFVIGLFFSKQKKLFFYFWLFALMCYLFIFFNLNRVHNYYQIPFVPIFSVFIGLGINESSKWFQKESVKALVVFSLVLCFALESTYYSEKNYYEIKHLHLDIGAEIQQNTKPNDLIVVNFENIDSKCPNFLYAARRNGWGIPKWGLEGSVLYKLMLEGADYFAFVSKVPPMGEIEGFLKEFPVQKIKLRDKYTLYLYETKFKYLWEIMPPDVRKEIEAKGLL